ncbi:MAG: tetratricopeptide repeat protein [Bryobacteraceae bacterium]|nr:tetratricopeptide repeat protein [Bryobacteraceae bacterium]
MGRILLAITAAAALSLGQDVATNAAEAASAMRAGRFADAERLYTQLVRQEPKNPNWLANLGLALHSRSRYAEAVDALERSLKIKPAAGLYAVLGIDYLKLDQPCKAIAPLEQTDRTDALADAFYACKRYPEAARLYLRLNDTRRAARAWWQARDYAQARPLYEKLALKHAGDAEFAWEFGDTLLRVEGAAQAIPWLEKAMSLVEGRAALGKAYAEAGRFADAVPLLEGAVQADPDLLLPLSRSYKETGRAAEADRALSEYRRRQADRQN